MAHLARRFHTSIPELRRMTLWEIAVLVDLDAELTSGEEDHAKAIKEALNGR